MISVGLTYFLEKLIEKNFIDNRPSHYLNKNFKKYTPERRWLLRGVFSVFLFN